MDFSFVKWLGAHLDTRIFSDMAFWGGYLGYPDHNCGQLGSIWTWKVVSTHCTSIVNMMEVADKLDLHICRWIGVHLDSRISPDMGMLRLLGVS